MSGTPGQIKRHAQMGRRIDQLNKEIRQLQQQVFELADERERLALQALGLDIGSPVILTGTRFKGLEAVIVDAVAGPTGVALTKIGEKPDILVNVPGTRANHFRVSARLWAPSGV